MNKTSNAQAQNFLDDVEAFRLKYLEEPLLEAEIAKVTTGVTIFALMFECRKIAVSANQDDEHAALKMFEDFTNSIIADWQNQLISRP